MVGDRRAALGHNGKPHLLLAYKITIIKTTKLMSKLWSSSIGKKLVMSLSGLFLVIFLLVHLAANLFFYGGPEAYDAMCAFMDTNPFIRVMVPVLALGFIIHIAWATVITLKNQTARPVKYKVQDLSKSSAWESRNMYVLGIIVLGILVWHLSDFWADMQLQHFIGGHVDGSFATRPRGERQSIRRQGVRLGRVILGSQGERCKAAQSGCHQ